MKERVGRSPARLQVFPSSLHCHTYDIIQRTVHMDMQYRQLIVPSHSVEVFYSDLNKHISH